MQAPTAYLQFDGRCAEALTFYAETLGGTVGMMSKYGEAPPGTDMPPALAHWIMHGGSMPFGVDRGVASFVR